MRRVQPPSPLSLQYSRSTTDELLKLASEAASLRPEAVVQLRDELGRRGITDQDVQVQGIEEADRK